MKDHILSVKEKIGYGMGDAASHIIFDNVMLYMMCFYTDIFGIPRRLCRHHVPAGARLDAISDPVYGSALPTVPAAAGVSSAHGSSSALSRSASSAWLAYSLAGFGPQRQADLTPP